MVMDDDAPLSLRPRTVGEVLDDAWRFALAESPVLLALQALFAVPSFVAVLLVLTRPAPEAWTVALALPLLAAVTVPLTGLGTGACQEFLARRGQDQPAGLGQCLAAALRRAPEHLGARALVLAGVAIAGLFLVMPGVAVAASTATTHVLIVEGEAGLTAALRGAARDARRQPVKAAVVVLHWLPLFALVAVNLHLLTRFGVDVAASLGGLDTALLGHVLTLSNPVYLAALLFVSWLLLTPYAESCVYLLHQDGQVRFEGRDLARRLQAVFPGARAGVTAGILMLAAVAAPTARGADGGRVEVIRGVRRDVRRLLTDVRQAEPYPGSSRYEPRLRVLAVRLETSDPTGRSGWFRQQLEGFGRRGREGALEVLASLDEQLGLLEEATGDPGDGAGAKPRVPRDEVKALAPPADDEEGPPPRPEAPPEVHRPARRDDPGVDGRRDGGPAAVAPRAGGSGLGRIGWLVLGGLLGSVLMAAALLAWTRRSVRPDTGSSSGGELSLRALDLGEERSAAALWRQAEQEAARGRFREGSRLLYLAVLAHLHDAGCLRREAWRTNREYVTQVRQSEAGESCAQAFARLTRAFDRVWYGQRSCAEDEWAELKELAQRVRAEAAFGARAGAAEAGPP